MAPPWPRRGAMKHEWLSGMMFSVSHTRLAVLRGRRRRGPLRIHRIVSHITPFPPSHAHIHILHFHLLCHRTQGRFAALTVRLCLPFPFAGFIRMSVLIVTIPIPLIPPQLAGSYFRREKLCFKSIVQLYKRQIFPVLQTSLVNGLITTGGFKFKIKRYSCLSGSLRYSQVPPTRNILKNWLD